MFCSFRKAECISSLFHVLKHTGTPEIMYSREPNGVASAYFIAHKFSYLNIKNIGSKHVEDSLYCGFECVAMPSCFSFNLLALPDVSGKRLCELLPSDIYRNSEMFFPNHSFHHFSIPVRFY